MALLIFTVSLVKRYEAASHRDAVKVTDLSKEWPPDERSDFSDIFRNGVELDFAVWEQKGVSLAKLQDFIRKIMTRSANFDRYDFAVIVFSNDEIFIGYTDGEPHKDGYFHRVHGFTYSLVHQWWDKKRPLNNTILILNPHDLGFCRTKDACTAPIFSTFKRWDWDTRSGDEDILIPVSNHNWNHAYTYPWEQKQQRGLFRGSLNCWHRPNATNLDYCSRYTVHQYGLSNNDILDVGIVNLPEWEGKLAKLELAERVSMADHARWKYLLSLDGVSGSSRLEKLMLVNSVTVRESSQYIDAYIRGMKNMTHFVEVDRNAVGDVGFKWAIDWLKANDAEAQKISNAGQNFGIRNFNARSRGAIMYHTVAQYTAMFGTELGEFVKSLNIPPISEGGVALSWNVMQRIAGIASA